MKSFQEISAKEDTNTSSWDGNSTSKHAGLFVIESKLLSYNGLRINNLLKSYSITIITISVKLLTMLLLKLNCVSRYFGRKTMNPDTMISSVHAP